jgi:hypothetical protein
VTRANPVIRVKDVIHHAILVIHAIPVTLAKEHANHASHAILAKLFAIRARFAIIYVKRATHVGYIEVMRD